MQCEQLSLLPQPTIKLFEGDCLDVMRGLADNSIDFVVCDPPYALTGKSGKGGFMGKEWDSSIPGVDVWKEALRICKPGSMLAAFGGSRTHHHLMIALEQAGWEIRDVMMFLYGTGFPKSLNIGKHVPGFEGYLTQLKPAYEPIILCMKTLDGTYAQNAMKWGVAGMNIDSCRIPTNDNWVRDRTNDPSDMGMWKGKKKILQESNLNGRYPSNIILDECSAEMLDQQSGVQASRFFYTAKASASERNKGLEGMPLKKKSGCYGEFKDGTHYKEERQNFHPTVKPLSLMRYIIKLLAPPVSPTCLDCFAGSGTTLLACKELGVDCIGIEKEPEYCEIIRKRLKIGE